MKRVRRENSRQVIAAGKSDLLYQQCIWHPILTKNEAKRRIKVATLFSSEASRLRLVCAILMEIAEKWKILLWSYRQNEFTEKMFIPRFPLISL